MQALRRRRPGRARRAALHNDLQTAGRLDLRPSSAARSRRRASRRARRPRLRLRPDLRVPRRDAEHAPTLAAALHGVRRGRAVVRVPAARWPAPTWWTPVRLSADGATWSTSSGSQALRRPRRCSTDVSLGVGDGRADRRRRPQRRRQDHAAAAAGRPRGARRRPGVAAAAACTSATSTRATTSTPATPSREVGARRQRRPRVGRRRRAPARSSRCCSPGVALRPRRRRALRRRAPALLAGRAAARRPRPRASSTSRPTTSTSRRSPGWPRHLRSAGRPAAARSSWSPTTAGSSTRSASGPGRCTTASSTPTTAGTPPSCSPRPSGSGRPRPSEERARRTWCARSWPGCAAARRPAPRSRSSGIDAANALIEDEPPPRDRLELRAVRHRSGSARTSSTSRTSTCVLRRPGSCSATPPGGSAPGDRVGIVGVNGAGKTSVLRLLAGALAPDRRAGQARADGPARRCSPRSCATSTPDVAGLRVQEAVEQVDGVGRIGGREVTAGQLLERFGFTGDRLWTAGSATCPAASGGGCSCCGCCSPSPTCCCSTSPPTTSTSTRSPRWRTPRRLARHAWSSSRTTATSWSGSATGRWRCSATGGSATCPAASRSTSRCAAAVRRRPPPGRAPARAGRAGRRPGDMREARKELARLERQLSRLAEPSTRCTPSWPSTPPTTRRLLELDAKLRELQDERRPLEEEWLEAAELSGLTRARSARASSKGPTRRRSCAARDARDASSSSASRRRSRCSRSSSAVSTSDAALVRQADQHAAPVGGVGPAPDQRPVLQPVDPVRHRAAGDQGLRGELARGELVGRAGPAQRREHVELPHLEAVRARRPRRGRGRGAAPAGSPATAPPAGLTSRSGRSRRQAATMRSTSSWRPCGHRRPGRSVRDGLRSRPDSPFHARFTRCAATSCFFGLRASSHHWPVAPPCRPASARTAAPPWRRSRGPRTRRPGCAPPGSRCR